MVKLHAAKSGLPEIEAVKFWTYYDSNGWRVGRNPMQKWQSALTHWKTNYESGLYSNRGNGGSRRGDTAENPRNAGTCPPVGDYAAAARRLASQTAALAGQVDKAQSDLPGT
jgi:hypothetical protein